MSDRPPPAGLLVMRERRALLAAAMSLGTMLVGGRVLAAIPADDRRLVTRDVTWDAAGRTMRGYMAIPARARGRQPTVILIHDGDAPGEPIRDHARRIALSGTVALAPDFTAEPAQRLADALATLRWLKNHRYGTGRTAAIGFGAGGAAVCALAAAGGDALGAGVDFYGAAPFPTDAARVRAPMLFHVAGRDDPGIRRWAGALAAAGGSAIVHDYPAAAPGFADEGRPAYDAAAASLAWGRTLAFLHQHLRG